MASHNDMPLTINFSNASIEQSLKRIADELHVMNGILSRVTAPQDFSEEDGLVKSMTEKVKDALARVPGQKED